MSDDSSSDSSSGSGWSGTNTTTLSGISKASGTTDSSDSSSQSVSTAPGAYAGMPFYNPSTGQTETYNPGGVNGRYSGGSTGASPTYNDYDQGIVNKNTVDPSTSGFDFETVNAALASGKPVVYNPDGTLNWAYNAKDPGWREKFNDMTTAPKGSLLYRLGFRGAGLPQEQFEKLETKEEKADRMQLAGGLIAKAVTSFMPAPVGLVTSIAQAAGNVSNGVGYDKAFGGIVPGLINGVLNSASGGMVGKANMASSIVSALGGPSMPNIGAKVYESLGGGYAGKTVTNPNTGSPYAYPDGSPITSYGSRSSSNSSSAPAPQAAPIELPASKTINSSMYSIDDAGWTSATNKYLGSRSKRRS